jgi:hypothetical protein
VVEMKKNLKKKTLGESLIDIAATGFYIVWTGGLVIAVTALIMLWGFQGIGGFLCWLGG